MYLRKRAGLPISLPQLLACSRIKREQTDRFIRRHAAHENSASSDHRTTNTITDLRGPSNIFGGRKLDRER